MQMNNYSIPEEDEREEDQNVFLNPAIMMQFAAPHPQMTNFQINRFDDLLSNRSIDKNSMMSIDINNGNSLLDELTVSYPSEDMRKSLQQLPDANESYPNGSELARSQASSECHSIKTTSTIDVIVVEQNKTIRT